MIKTIVDRIRRTFRLDGKSRQIFRFRVGKSWRYVDPVAVAMALAEHKEYLPKHLAEARAGDKEAIEICGRAACDAFGLDTLESSDTQGLSLVDRVNLLHDFDTWKIVLKQRHDAFCRLAAIHGCNIDAISPELFCALYFSRIESEIRIAETIRLGNRSVYSSLPLGWFCATRDTFDEAQAAYDRHQAAVAASKKVEFQ